MTETKKNIERPTHVNKRSWIEKNGPTIYGAIVFAALGALMVVHFLASA